MRAGSEKIKLKETIVVEGKYDKITLSDFLDANIVEVNGFGVYRDRELISMLRALAKKDGIVVLMDSDRAGFLIRGHLSSSIQEGDIKHAYIPDIAGKEPRKREFSKEKKLGVEGMRREVLLEALKKAGVVPGGREKSGEEIAVRDLFAGGITGRAFSKALREEFLESLGLPKRLGGNALLGALNKMFTRAEFLSALEQYKNGRFKE